MTIQVTRAEAVALIKALSFPSADKWSNEKLTTQIGLVHEIIDDNFKVEGEEAESALAKVLAAAEADEDIEVVDELDPVEEDEIDTDIDEEEEEDEPEDIDESVNTEVEPEPEDDLEEGEEIEVEPEPEDDLPADEEPPTEAKVTFDVRIEADKDKEKAKPKKKSTGKQRSKKGTVAFLAGQVVSKHGTNAGVTVEMVQELNRLLGEEAGTCERQRRYVLTTVMQGVMGYIQPSSE